jgi:hypothetical protein
VIASHYVGTPVHIEEVPNNFKRDCFLVKLATDSTGLKNLNVYQDNPIFQIVYFGKRSEANQVQAEELYKVKEELKALFLLHKVVPVIPLEDVKERQRYAKISSYSSEVRIDEGAVYTKLSLSFTEDIPKSGEYDLMQDVEFTTEYKTNG